MAPLKSVRASDRTIGIWSLLASLAGLVVTVSAPYLTFVGMLSGPVGGAVIFSGAMLLAASAFAYWHARKMKFLRKHETLAMLKKLVSSARDRVSLLRTHHLFLDGLDEFYEALGAALRARPELEVRRAILIRDSNNDEATRRHLWKLQAIFENKMNCEIAFAYEAAIGFNMAIIDEVAIVGIPGEGRGNFSGAVVVRDSNAVALLQVAFSEFWHSPRCEFWFKGTETPSKDQLSEKLDKAFEKARRVSDLIGKPYRERVKKVRKGERAVV